MNSLSAFPVEQWDVADVQPYPFNHKKHPEKQIEMLMKSLKQQGLLDPIAVDEKGVIISGHGRFEAIKRLGWLKVTVRCLRGITEEQASALRIAANKTVSNEYDTDMLSHELSKLSQVDYDLSGLGFEQKELDMLLVDVGEIDESTITMDIDGAVEAHEADVEERSSAADNSMVRLDKAFGFKELPLKDQKVITRFMAEVEAKTGKAGPDALIDHMKSFLVAA